MRGEARAEFSFGNTNDLKEVMRTLEELLSQGGSVRVTAQVVPTRAQALSRDVAFLDIPSKAYNLLIRENILTVEQLVSKTEHDMFRIKGFGRKFLNAVKEDLSRCGLYLGMQNDQIAEILKE